MTERLKLKKIFFKHTKIPKKHSSITPQLQLIHENDTDYSMQQEMDPIHFPPHEKTCHFKRIPTPHHALSEKNQKLLLFLREKFHHLTGMHSISDHL